MRRTAVSIPISCILTSASSHDSQSAIPLAAITSRRISNCYDLMDCAYDAPEIHEYSCRLDHVPLIDIHPRRNKALKEELANESNRCKVANYQTPKAQCYNERSTV